MKKIFKIVACLSLGLSGLTTVKAKEMDLSKGDILATNNVYIVGNWVFQLNQYGINGKDIAHAASRYSLLTGKDAPVYYVLGGEVYEYDTRGAEATPKDKGKLEEVFDKDIINALGLNGNEYQDLVVEEVDPAIRSAIEELNKTASTYGFERITYENNTATFYISDPSKKLADYKTQVMNLIKEIINGKYGFQSVEFDGKKTEASEFKDTQAETKITELAVQVLTKMAGKDAKTLNYASVANKEAKAIVTYKDSENSEEYNVTYTLKFVYDFEKEKDTVLTSAAKELDKKVKEDITSQESKNYGFSGVNYDASNHTLTFDIYDPNAKLSAFADSGIVNLFKNGYSGATHVEWTIGTENESFDLKDSEDDADIKRFALEVLTALVKDSAEADAQEKLILKNVAGKEAKAEITYADGTEVTYTLKFNYNVEEAKDTLLETFAPKLAEEGKSKGFSNVAYDSSSKTITFTNSGFDVSLKDFAQTSIIKFFEKWSSGATSVTYKVNGEEQTYTPQSFSSARESTGAMQLAAELLCHMAYGNDTSKCDSSHYATTAISLKNGDVAGTSAEATFTFDDGKQITYHLKFDYDIESDMDALFTDYANSFATMSKVNDFSNITYADKTLTFTFKSEKSESKLKDWTGRNELVNMFEKTIVGASKFEWTVGDTTKKYTVSTAEDKLEMKVENSEVSTTTTALAAEILLEMAKSSESSQNQANQLTYGNVAGKEAKAKVTYQIGKKTETIEYTLKFVQEPAGPTA